MQGIERTTDGRCRRPRFGLTVSRKVGTATERNRVKRRLRAALRRIADPDGALRETALVPKQGCDYVVVARRDVLRPSSPR